MKRKSALLMVGLFGFSMVGCARITTQVVEKPRVDQQLEGNRGFLAGSAPAGISRKSTRKIIQTDVELPTAGELNPWRARKAPLAPQPVATVPTSPVVSPGIEEEWEEPLLEEPIGAPPVTWLPEPTPYTVKAGDTLEKIAANVYGDAGQWHRIYNANRDRLASPNKIYPGQKLIIPAAQEKKKGVPPAGEFK